MKKRRKKTESVQRWKRQKEEKGTKVYKEGINLKVCKDRKRKKKGENLTCAKVVKEEKKE